MPPLTAFPTTFPAEAAAKLGAAIIAKRFTKDLIEPIYDLLGFFAYRVLGSTDDVPVPAPVPAGFRTFGAGLEVQDETERVGHMLCALADMQKEKMGSTLGVMMPGAIEWSLVIKVILSILQGLLLGVLPSPIPNPFPEPAPAPASK